MTDSVLAGAERTAPATLTAGELAARIPVPTRLPDRYDGEPLRHLSASSYSLWLSCPDAWRRRYIKGEKQAPSGSMFLGSRVDDALSAYHRRILEHGDRLAPPAPRASRARIPRSSPVVRVVLTSDALICLRRFPGLAICANSSSLAG
jgi:hypothetical protein